MTVRCAHCGVVLGPEPEVPRWHQQEVWLCVECYMNETPAEEEEDE